MNIIVLSIENVVFICLNIGLYANRGIRLDLIQVYGFDYDFTLAHYSANLQSLIYDLAKEHMVNEVSICMICCCYLVGVFVVQHIVGVDELLFVVFLQFKYPEVCMSFKYDPYFPIRGLYYDRQNGCLLKLDFFGSIEPDGCFYGRRQVMINYL